MTPNSSQYEIANVDREIHALETRIVGLRSTRNTLIPIGQLPAEVLERIFDVARKQGTQTIHLTWVSRAWREVVLGCKTLWALINNSNLRWMSIYLDRSLPIPLVLNFEKAFPKDKILSMALEHLSRVKVLIL
ncbi:hypothetical protein BDN72DRAFT_764926, partial [Pluteus cervinus]